MMAAQWTPTGDKWPQMAMVMVRERSTATPGWWQIISHGGESVYHLHEEQLRPMPPTITPEQQAVLDAAVGRMSNAVNALEAKS